MKKKKGFIPFKKTIIPVISILMIVIATLIFVYTIDNKKFYKDHYAYDDKYLFRILYLFMDEDKVSKDITIDGAFESKESMSAIIGTSSIIIPLEKKGDYLYADLNKYTNQIVLEKETDYLFTNYNNNGEVIDGCEYDKEKNIIKVPFSYYEGLKSKAKPPIQVQIQSLLKKDNKNYSVKTNIKKLITKSKNVKQKTGDIDTLIEIGKFGFGELTDDRVHVYVNNSKEELSKDKYDIENDNVRIYISPSLIGEVDIKVDFSFLGKTFAATKFKRVSPDYSDWDHMIEVDAPINLPEGYPFEIDFTMKSNGSGGVLDGPDDDYDINYCNNGTCGVIEGGNNQGWKAEYANWYYTYIPWDSQTAFLETPNQVESDGDGWNTTSGVMGQMTYRIKLNTIVGKVNEQLEARGEERTNVKKDTMNSYGGSTNRDWIAFYCTHTGKQAKLIINDDGNYAVNYTITVVDRDEENNTITLSIISNWETFGQESNAYLKFHWEDKPGFKIKKEDSRGRTVEGLKFYAYNIDDSNEAVHEAVTNSDGIATFEEDLNKNGHYYFYEQCSGYSSENPIIVHDGSTTVGSYTNLYDAEIECTFPDRDNSFNGGDVVDYHGYVPTNDYQTANPGSMTNNNIPGLAVKKTDGEGHVIEGITIYAYNIKDSSETVHTATTGADGIATFRNLTDGGEYELYEKCDSSPIKVGGTSYTSLDDADISCTYDITTRNTNNDRAYRPNSTIGFSPTIDYYTTARIIEMENIKYRHCAVVKKTKGKSRKPEPGAQFRLTVAAGVCDRGEITAAANMTKTTGDDGFVEFVGLGYCRGGSRTATVELIDQRHLASLEDGEVNPRTVSLQRSKVVVTNSNGTSYKGINYAKDQEIAISSSDWNTYKSDVKETCEHPSSPTEFKDKGYLISWVKQNQTLKNNNNPTTMANIGFNVKKNGTTIRVKTTKYNYTDIDNITKSCYEYTEDTGSGTTELVQSDANGMVCIYNFPNETDTFTVTEVSTNYYYNESLTNLKAKEKFSDFNSTKYNNWEYLIDWNKKETNNGKSSNSNGKLKNAKFTVKNGNTTIKTKPNKETVYDKNGTAKSCYVVDLLNASNNTNSDFYSDNDGYICIMGLDKSKTYTVTETDPSKYYAYANSREFTEVPKTTFNTNTTSTVYQCPTEVKITKSTTELASATEAYKRIVYTELQKLTFNVVEKSTGRVLSFKYNSTSGRYEYVDAINELRGTNETGDTRVRLLPGVNVETASLSSMNLDMIFNYLPEGKYIIKEVSSKSCGSTSSTASDGSNCTCANTTPDSSQATTEEASCSNMGYGHVADQEFTVTDNNNGDSVTCDKTDNSVKLSILNKPTVVNFTKKDFYTYFNDADTVKFENDEEIEAFDNITFKVRDKSSVDLSGVSSIASNVYKWFYKIKDGEYRYDVLHKCTSEGQMVGGYACTQNLHTDNGEMKLTHLCKCDDYYIEEYEVPDGTVFILPKLEGNSCASGYMKVNKNGKLECHPIKAIKICDCDDDSPESSPPVKIEDLPTKQVFIKKDLKYNTIITDQRTTFELYLTTEEAAAAGRSCNPYDATSKANDCIQIGFSKYEVLQSKDIDEEDGISHSYIMSLNASANDIKQLKLDPVTGKLIFRYLPSYIDREYVLMETVAPKGYDLPTGEKSVTRFRVANDTVNVEVSNVPNKPSKAIIGKYDIATGKLIPGFKFKVYKVSNYDENLTPMMQSRGEALEFKTIRDGSYEYREVFDTDLVTTCTNKEGSPCSDISTTLVDDTYSSTDMGALESTTTIQEGQALIQYLDTNAYYVIEEVEAPKGYKLPERESDRFTSFYVPESEDVTKETKIYNTETYFTFFKYDEFNNVKDGATFKLQKLNNDKIYEDVAVEDVSTENTKMYKVLSTSENYDITTLNGQATIYRLTEGQYRIIETKAPEGYELPKKTYNVVTFLVDKKGHTYGSNVIANKKKTEKYMVVPESQAELVVNIQTGKVVIKYGLIIAGILGLISLLIYIRKKISK